MKKLFIIVIAASLTGCAGLDISSLSVDKANNAHKPNNGVKGYIVYHPMMVVEVGEKELCIARNDAGRCVKVKTVCGIGEPKTLPDYSKPYLLNPKSGFGKSGVEVKVVDGWRLGGINNESDNTALLSVLAAAGGIQALTAVDKITSGCTETGLYRLSFKNRSMKLTPLLKY